MIERKGRVRLRNKEAGDEREERGKRSYGSYKTRTTATAGANSSTFAATTALSATAAAETTTAICLNATANDWYDSDYTNTRLQCENSLLRARQSVC